MNRNFILLILVLTGILSVSVNAQKTETLALSKKVVQALKNKDMKTLATYVHPIKGVRFSPYSSVNQDSDRVFKKSGIPGLFSSKRNIYGANMTVRAIPSIKVFQNISMNLFMTGILQEPKRFRMKTDSAVEIRFSTSRTFIPMQNLSNTILRREKTAMKWAGRACF